MEPFSGNYTEGKGDRFIFKGGVTWPNAACPLKITSAGADSQPNVYGADRTWYVGENWARPIFDAEGRTLTNHAGNSGNMIRVAGATNLTLDSLELRNWEVTSSRTANSAHAIYVERSNNITITNCYMHDWVVRTPTDGKFGGVAATASRSINLLNSHIRAPRSVDSAYRSDKKGHTSGAGFVGLSLVDGCEISGTTQGAWNAGIIRNCYIHDGGDSFDAKAHENAVWIQNTKEFYNNRVENWTEGVGMYALPGWGKRSPHRINIYNNVFDRIPQINLTPQQNPDTRNEIWFFNNLVARSLVQLGTKKTVLGEPFNALVIENNLLVNSMLKVLDPKDLGEHYTNRNNVSLSLEEAQRLGLRSTNWFKPTRPVRSLTKGTPFTQVTGSDFFGQPRSSTVWTIGPYEFPREQQN